MTILAEKTETSPYLQERAAEFVSRYRKKLPKWLTESADSRAGFCVTHWGDTTIVSSPMAIELPNQVMQARMEAEGIEPEVAEYVLNTTGIPIRHASPPQTENRLPQDIFDGAMTRTQEQVMQESSAMTGLLLQVAMAESGLRPSHIIVSNLNLRHRYSQMIADAAGLEDVTVESVRAACAGSVLAKTLAMTNPELNERDNQVVAIVSSEPSGHLQVRRHYSEAEHTPIPATFTDLHVVELFDLRRYKLLDHRILVVPGGGIDVETEYQESYYQAHHPSLPFLNIEYRNGGENVLYINDQGLFMDVPRPKNGMTSVMNGLITASHFRDWTSEFIIEFIEKYGVDKIPKFISCHQPSYSVIRQINRQIMIYFKKNYRKLFDKGEYLQIPFVLPQIGTGNGTSATEKVTQQYLIETMEPTPDPNAAFLEIAPGIGSSFVWALIQRKAA